MINSHFGFTPLKEVWLGDCYPAAWYDHLPNEIADPFRQITEWTQEDTGKLQKFLEARGIQVRRPVFESIDDYINDVGILVKPPITPRDHYFTLGNSLYSLHRFVSKDPWRHIIDEYAQQGLDAQIVKDLPISCISPPSVVRIGQDLYIDIETHSPVWGFVCEWMIEISKDYRVNICNTQGHSDAVFCPVAPGLIVSSHYKNDYKKTFPGWELFKVPRNLSNSKYSTKNWLSNDPIIDNNTAFSQHIATLAKDWIGNFRETVPEVNMLVLDEKNVVAMKEYAPLAQWLDQHGITVHYFDFRARSFWDGGWHCLTLDIERTDTKKDLFPSRGPNGVFWRELLEN